MADTAIAITAGTGTNVDTRTEGTNGNHRQVIVIGDPATNAGVAPVDATTGLAVNVTNASLTVASHAVTNAGTFAVQAAATLAAETTKVIGTVNVAAAQTIAATNAGTFAVQATTVPADPFGVNADAASATGSISAKLRFIAATGIPITGTVTVGSHAVTIASGGVASGGVASGAFASGALASGSVASGAFASGSVADGAMVTLGAKTDAKSSSTDATSITVMQVLKQVSAELQLVRTALGSTAFDLGVGTGGTRTLRVSVDSSQTDGSEYETVAASQTAQVIGATGAAGDYLSHVVVSPATAGCGVVTILDNATSIVAFPGGGTTTLSNLIPFIIPVGITSTSGAWKITTGANVSCVAVGNFT